MNKISEEDLSKLHAVLSVNSLRQKNAQLELDNVNLENDNTILKIYVKYQLFEKDKLNTQTGEITKNEE
jgi:hypothetical protein